MGDLIQRIAEEYNVTEEQAVVLIRLLQSPDTVDSKFWEVLQDITDKRLRGIPII